MQKISYNINTLENELMLFFNTLENDYNRLGSNTKTISFDTFRFAFCKNTILGETIAPSNSPQYIELYKHISSSTSKFFLKLRNKILEIFCREIKFCPYCGKNPLIYFDETNEKKRMFQFDHFFDKSTYKHLAINFLNLIPSCNACNHLKSNNDVMAVLTNGGILFHPYFGRIKKENGVIIQDCNCFFDESTKFNGANIFDTPHSQFFHLDKIYFNSQDTFNEIRFIRDKIEKIKTDYINTKKLKGGSFKFEKEKSRYFKNYYPEKKEEVLLYSNGKLRKDLIDGILELNNSG